MRSMFINDDYSRALLYIDYSIPDKGDREKTLDDINEITEESFVGKSISNVVQLEEAMFEKERFKEAAKKIPTT